MSDDYTDDSDSIEEEYEDDTVEVSTEKWVGAVGSQLVVSKRPSQATGLYGLYAEVIAYSSVSQAMAMELRLFVVDRWLCRYSRKRHRKSGRWITGTYSDHAAAVEAAAGCIQRYENLGYDTIMRGDLMLVELSTKDLIALEQNDHPPSRFTAATAFEKKYGSMPSDTDWTTDKVAQMVVDYDEPLQLEVA